MELVTYCLVAWSYHQGLWSYPVLVAIIASTMVGAVAPLLSIPVFAALMFVDVMSSVVRSSVVDKVLLDRHHLLASKGWFLMD